MKRFSGTKTLGKTSYFWGVCNCIFVMRNYLNNFCSFVTDGQRRGQEQKSLITNLSDSLTQFTFDHKMYKQKIDRESFPDPGQPSNRNPLENASSDAPWGLTWIWTLCRSLRTCTHFLCEYFARVHLVVLDSQMVVGISSVYKIPKIKNIKNQWLVYTCRFSAYFDFREMRKQMFVFLRKMQNWEIWICQPQK